MLQLLENVARNVVIFGVDYSSLSQTNNRKNNVLVLGKGPTQEINDTTGAAEKKIVLIFVQRIQNFA